MSGALRPLRSPWFGDDRTSATTQESGRSSDNSATIRAPPNAVADADDARSTKIRRGRTVTIVQKRVLRDKPRRAAHCHARGESRVGVARRPHSPRARLKTCRRPGRRCRRPGPSTLTEAVCYRSHATDAYLRYSLTL